MLRLANVATPLTAAAESVPVSVPVAGFAPIATVIVPVNPVTTPFAASSADTRTVGIVVPACVLAGWVEKVRGGTGGAEGLNAVLGAPVRPLAVAVSV